MPKGGNRKSKGETPKGGSSKGKKRREDSPDSDPRTPPVAKFAQTPLQPRPPKKLDVEKHRRTLEVSFPEMIPKFKSTKRGLSQNSRDLIDGMVEESNKRRRVFLQNVSSSDSILRNVELDEQYLALVREKLGIMALDADTAQEFADALARERDEETRSLPGVRSEIIDRAIKDLDQFVSNHRECRNIYKATAHSAATEWKNSSALRAASGDDMLLHLDLVAQRDHPPLGATVRFKDSDWVEEQRPRFRKSMISNYDAQDRKRGDKTWCCVLRDYFPNSEVIAAHLSPTSWSESLQEYFFGSNGPHMFNERNCLPLHRNLEALLDGGAIAILPADKGDLDPDGGDKTTKHLQTRLKAVVLFQEFDPFQYEDSSGNLQSFDSKRLHGRILGFLNDFRPGRRYLWFRYALNIIRRKRFQVKGWEHDVKYFGKYWGSPGPYTRKSTLMTLAQLIGHTNDIGDLEVFTSDKEGDEEKDQKIAESLQRSLFPPSRYASGAFNYGSDDNDDLAEGFQDIDLGEESEETGK